MSAESHRIAALPIATEAETLEELRFNARRQKHEHNLRTKAWAAVVRTDDYNVIIPICKTKNGFRPTAHRIARERGLRHPQRKELMEVIGETEDLALQIAQWVDGCSQTLVLDFPPRKVKRERTRNKLASETRQDKEKRREHGQTDPVAAKAYFNPKKLMGKAMSFIPAFEVLLKGGCTDLEVILYGWMAFRANADGIFSATNSKFRYSDRQIAQLLNRSESGVVKVKQSLRLKGFIDYPEDGERSIKPVRFIWKESMGIAAPPSGADASDATPLKGAALPHLVRQSEPQSEADFRGHKNGRTLKNDSGNRELSLSSEEHATWFDKSSDPGWVDICQWLGREEMGRWGAGWKKRWNQNADRLHSALRHAKKDEAVAQKRADNRAAVLNAIWERDARLWN